MGHGPWKTYAAHVPGDLKDEVDDLHTAALPGKVRFDRHPMPMYEYRYVPYASQHSRQ